MLKVAPAAVKAIGAGPREANRSKVTVIKVTNDSSRIIDVNAV
jgi:hypothetical protein